MNAHLCVSSCCFDKMAALRGCDISRGSRPRSCMNERSATWLRPVASLFNAAAEQRSFRSNFFLLLRPRDICVHLCSSSLDPFSTSCLHPFFAIGLRLCLPFTSQYVYILSSSSPKTQKKRKTIAVGRMLSIRFDGLELKTASSFCSCCHGNRRRGESFVPCLPADCPLGSFIREDCSKRKVEKNRLCKNTSLLVRETCESKIGKSSGYSFKCRTSGGRIFGNYVMAPNCGLQEGNAPTGYRWIRCDSLQH